MNKVEKIDMAYSPGRKKTGGRKPGVPNRMSLTVKQSVLDAFEELGGVQYLLQVAKDDPKTFCAMLAKIIPSDINADIKASGEFVVRWATDDD